MQKKEQQPLPENSRITNTRQSIWDCLNHYRSPLDYKQIQSLLNEKDIFVNKTTIYRQLNYFQRNGLIQEIDLGEGKKRYEIVSNHHHHLLCTDCHIIKCMEFKENINRQLGEISESTNFKVTGHMLEFSGLCEKCQNNSRQINHV